MFSFEAFSKYPRGTVTGELGPGSAPQLHTGPVTYCYHPVVTAKFLLTEVEGPPVRLHVLLFEVRNRVYGQVLSELQHYRFPEHPVSAPDTGQGLIDLEFESEDFSDPLVAVAKTIDALQVRTSNWGGDPILDEIEVLKSDYVESGKSLVRSFATPLSTVRGKLSQEDVLLSAPKH